MKLVNLNESQLLTNIEDIANYLNDEFGYDKKVGVDKDGNVTVYNDLVIYKSKTPLRIKLKSTKSLEISYTYAKHLSSFLPEIATDLKIAWCNYLESHINITTHVPDYWINVEHCETIQAIETLSPKIFVIDCKSFNGLLHTSTADTSAIVINSCPKIYRFSQCNTKAHLTHLVFENCFLETLENFNIKTNNLSIARCQSIKDCSGIENLNATEMLRLDIYPHMTRHLINILLNTSPKLTTTYKDFEKDTLENIMLEYEGKNISKRANYIMDCAVELIDAGFEEAAEL